MDQPVVLDAFLKFVQFSLIELLSLAVLGNLDCVDCDKAFHSNSLKEKGAETPWMMRLDYAATTPVTRSMG
jgi:hypothetical protein